MIAQPDGYDVATSSKWGGYALQRILKIGNILNNLLHKNNFPVKNEKNTVHLQVCFM